MNNLLTDDKRYVLDTSRVFPPESLTTVHLFFPLNPTESVEEIILPEDLTEEELSDQIQELLNCPRELIEWKRTPMGIFYFNKEGLFNSRANIVDQNDGCPISSTRDDPILGDAILIRVLRSYYFHKLLRPELVQSRQRPLSSDAFTGYQSPHDPDKETHQREVEEATKYLLKKKIPECANKLNKHQYTPVDHKDLVRFMHSEGINVRYLGILRAWVSPSAPHLRSFILTEMVILAVSPTD